MQYKDRTTVLWIEPPAAPRHSGSDGGRACGRAWATLEEEGSRHTDLDDLSSSVPPRMLFILRAESAIRPHAGRAQPV